MEQTTQEHFNKKWQGVIANLPQGGDYRFDLRSHGQNILKAEVEEGSEVFDYACGLARISTELEREKKCKIAGNDFSSVAIEFLKDTSNGDFRETGDIFGGPYDVIIASHFLEHIKEPVKWVENMFQHTSKILIILPRICQGWNYIR